MEIKYGKNLPTSMLKNEGYYVFGGNGVIGYNNEYMYEEAQILVSCRGAASGKVLESYPYSFITNNSLILELKDRRYYEFFKRYLLINPLYNHVTGSAQPQVTIDNLKYVKVPDIKIDEICNLINLLSKISQFQYNNGQQVIKLQKIKNTLLPKLMLESGESSSDKLSFIVLFIQSDQAEVTSDQPGKIGPHYIPCVYWGLGYTRPARIFVFR